jgi:Holliday junction resolvase RusA-like endonuclease
VRTVRFHVDGQPVAQGSKACRCIAGRGLLFESTKGVRPWRTAVKRAAKLAAQRSGVVYPSRVPLAVSLSFELRRPVGLRSRIAWCAVKPDVDKLTRAVLDALVDGGLIPDDAQVAVLHVRKRFGPEPGVAIVIRDAPDVYARPPYETTEMP